MCSADIVTKGQRASLHGMHSITTFINQVHQWLICDDLSPSAGTASHFWVLKVKPWKFSPGTMMSKGTSVIKHSFYSYASICTTAFLMSILYHLKVWTASRVELWPSEKANECYSQIQIRWAWDCCHFHCVDYDLMLAFSPHHALCL